jgi:hypothetical protein
MKHQPKNLTSSDPTLLNIEYNIANLSILKGDYNEALRVFNTLL